MEFIVSGRDPERIGVPGFGNGEEPVAYAIGKVGGSVGLSSWGTRR